MSLRQWRIATGTRNIRKLVRNGTENCFDHTPWVMKCAYSCQCYVIHKTIFMFFTPFFEILEHLELYLDITFARNDMLVTIQELGVLDVDLNIKLNYWKMFGAISKTE